MAEKIIVEEQFSSKWKMTAYTATVAAVLFFIIFLTLQNPLWKGIFRFTAFIAFIGVVFSLLRLREGQKKLTIEFLNEQLLITYVKKDEPVKEEVFDKKTVKKVYKKEVESFSRLPFLNKGCEFFITFTDTDNEIPLFEYSGRNLQFSKHTSKEITRFLNQYIYSTPE